MNNSDYMKIAYEEALKAYRHKEAPVGAIIVYKDTIIARAYNKRETLKSPTAHAEIIAIEQAAKTLNSWRLIDCDLYVTLEPCFMCAGAILNARIRKLNISAMDPKAGAVGSIINILNIEKLNHKVEVSYGIMANESSLLLKNFFSDLRKNNIK